MVDRSAAAPVFIGRGPELEVARAALTATAAGTSLHLLVAGEAGVGKSRFLAEVEQEALARGFRVVSGGSVPVGQA